MKFREREKIWRNRRLIHALLCGLIFVSLNSCVGKLAFKRGEEAYRTKDWDRSVDYYLKAIQTDPNNPRYRLSLAKALIESANFHCERGDAFFEQKEWKLALIEYQKALDNYPEHLRAKKRKAEVLEKINQEKKTSNEKTEIEKIKEKAARRAPVLPILGAGSETLINLKFKDIDLKEIFQAFQKSSGINFLFDESFKSKKLSIDLQNVTFKEALNRVLMISSLFSTILDEQTILIIPDTPVKRREYEELVLKTFYLSNGDVNQIQNLLRTLADIKVIAVNPILNTISIRESPQKIKIAEKIIASQDKAKAELLIDVEILEVNKSRMREYGIELSNYQITESLAPGASTSESGYSSVRGHMFYTLNSSDFLFSIPSVSYKLLENDTKSKIIAKPQLRVIDGETVSVKLGDKVPFPVTSFVPIAAGGVNQQAITSFQMYDVGISIDFTPRIHHNGEVTLKLKFELSFITVPGTATIPPTIGNRSVSTVIRMKDNETGLLAGMLRDSERRARRGFPGLINIPILRDLFGGTSDEVSQTDIILTLTPHITRMADISEEDLASIWVGTEKDIGIKPPPFQTIMEDVVSQKEKEQTDSIQKETALSLVPLLTEIPPNMTFMEKLMVENIKDLKTLDLSLTFDPSVVQVKDISEGDFMSQGGIKTAFLKEIQNESGNIHIVISGEGFKEGPSGTGEIASIIFEAKKEGRTAISVSGVKMQTSGFSDISANIREAEVVVKGE